MKSMKNIAKILAAATVAFAGAPAMADVDGLKLNSVTSNSAQNVQSNSGAVNLAPMGGSNANYQINSVSNSEYGFAPGIKCPTPELAFGVFGGLGLWHLWCFWCSWCLCCLWCLLSR